MSRIIKLKTNDEVAIAGDFYPLEEKTAPAVVLLHMMPSTKESWRNFAKKLNQAGFQVLAIDLRGHGESGGGPGGYRSFSDEEHKASINDVEAAVEFFISRGVPFKKISLAGASIGANLSLQFQSEHSEIKAGVLFSPGLSYHGIDTEPMVKKIQPDQSVFLAAGGENDEYSTETAQKLFNALKSKNKQIKIFHNAGHGTTMFMEEPALMNEIINWLKQIYL
ncbi:MAG TPA: alpha/beta fold hydrolase [Candidatus Campbellbacteria bacterium]|nr:alpha/beta fold hydrolase [Candidatus Campbellbacteria bacterium]